MDTHKTNCKDVSQYISMFSEEIQVILSKIRDIIIIAAPNASERISYGMPFYEYGGKGYAGRFLYFGAFKKHISLFIVPGISGTIPEEMKKFHISKATYQFPINQPVPYSLIKSTIRVLVEERDALNKDVGASDLEQSGNNAIVNTEILSYNESKNTSVREICNFLSSKISKGLAEADNKIWHGHPVWFIEGNPVVGYSAEKKGIRLMFWSGMSFEENKLNIHGKKFKDASIYYNGMSEIVPDDIQRWLKKCQNIQWDYKNIVKRKGILERLK